MQRTARQNLVYLLYLVPLIKALLSLKLDDAVWNAHQYLYIYCIKITFNLHSSDIEINIM